MKPPTAKATETPSETGASISQQEIEIARQIEAKREAERNAYYPPKPPKRRRTKERSNRRRVPQRRSKRR
jgi:hypothetical protein